MIYIFFVKEVGLDKIYLTPSPHFSPLDRVTGVGLHSMIYAAAMQPILLLHQLREVFHL